MVTPRTFPEAKHVHDGGPWSVGGGQMGELIRFMDWTDTPLGPIENSPTSLRTTVNLSLASNFPINIVWGSHYNQIYNDGYRVIVGERHPQAMGMPFDECWASAWPAVGEPFESAWTGKTSFIENQRMFLTRNGYLEETFFTFSLSSIRNERGVIVGFFHPVIETSAKMLGERRTGDLRAIFNHQGVTGTCLGLWVSSGILQRHQAKVRVRSSQSPTHHGTTFSIFFPIESEPTLSGSIDPTSSPASHADEVEKIAI